MVALTVTESTESTPVQQLSLGTEAARNLATRELKGGTHAANCTIQGLGKRLLGRNFSADEESVVEASLNELLAYYKAHPDDKGWRIAVRDTVYRWARATLVNEIGPRLRTIISSADHSVDARARQRMFI